jgi:hypothetical protein
MAIIGIDLGTSNSAAAVLRGGRPVIIPSAEGISLGGKAFPSYVAITADGQTLIGEPARRQRRGHSGWRSQRRGRRYRAGRCHPADCTQCTATGEAYRDIHHRRRHANRTIHVYQGNDPWPVTIPARANSILAASRRRPAAYPRLMSHWTSTPMAS